MNTNKNYSEYICVQEVHDSNPHGRDHTITIINTKNFEIDEIKQAMTLYKKRKANDIIYHRIYLLSKAPYVKDIMVFGERQIAYNKNHLPHEEVRFTDTQNGIDFSVPILTSDRSTIISTDKGATNLKS